MLSIDARMILSNAAVLGIHIDNHDWFVLVTSDTSMEPKIVVYGHLNLIDSYTVCATTISFSTEGEIWKALPTGDDNRKKHLESIFTGMKESAGMLYPFSGHLSCSYVALGAC
jgi:hypothetical protein